MCQWCLHPKLLLTVKIQYTRRPHDSDCIKDFRSFTPKQKTQTKLQCTSSVFEVQRSATLHIDFMDSAVHSCKYTAIACTATEVYSSVHAVHFTLHCEVWVLHVKFSTLQGKRNALQAKRYALQEKLIVAVQRSVHFAALEMHCTSIWELCSIRDNAKSSTSPQKGNSLQRGRGGQEPMSWDIVTIVCGRGDLDINTMSFLFSDTLNI